LLTRLKIERTILMSDINIFRAVFILPIAVGKLLGELHGAVDDLLIPRKRQIHWDTLGQRELKLKESYLKAQSHPMTLGNVGSSSQSMNLLTKHHTHLNAMVTAVKQMPVMNLNLNPNPVWTRCQKDIQRIGKAILTKRPTPEIISLANQTDSQIRQLTLSSHRSLALAEQNVVGNLTVDTLQTLGYQLKAKKTTLLGSTAKTSLRAKIEPGGGLVLDTTSFNGMDCHKEVARIENALKERGVVLQRVASGPRTRTQGVLLQDPFPAFNQHVEVSPVIDPLKAEQGSLNTAAEWLKRQHQYQKQRLHMKEG
jgi:hypothetical protein